VEKPPFRLEGPLQRGVAPLSEKLEIVLINGDHEDDEQEQGYKPDQQAVSLAADVSYFISHGFSILFVVASFFRRLR